MPIKKIDIIIMTCMYDEDRIGSRHGNIDNILKFCTPREYRDRYPLGKIKKRMRKLAGQNYLIRKTGRFEAYSLSMDGVRVAERWKEGWTIDEINRGKRNI